MKKTILLSTFVLLFGMVKSYAQIGFAVAKDENESSIRWSVATNNGWRTDDDAKNNLKNEGYKNVYNLQGGEKRGHHLTSGYWVVVKATRKNYEGILVTSYGLGASANSYSEAEERAISNLQQYDWNWSSKDGYTIEDKQAF